MTNNERTFASAISNLVYCNPFLPERFEYEQEVLGSDFIKMDTVWNIRANMEVMKPNVVKIGERVETLAGRLRERFSDSSQATEEELILYEDLILYLRYYRYREDFHETLVRTLDQKSVKKRIRFYGRFFRDAEHFFAVPGVIFPTQREPSHLFACFFQVRRALSHIFGCIVGGSMPSALLRATAWQSIFSHDMRRHRRAVYNRMGKITTLIMGQSGTGKGLVARAMGLSRYIPFDAETQTFSEDFAGSFYHLNISALSPSLIESEFFGHHRGAFTGGPEHRAGWLEVCQPLGTVFLDEIGDLDASIQVKLPSVLPTRTFQRIGEREDRHFHGKIIAATNRYLSQEMQAGRFREDSYYRLCSDMMVTPSLHEQLLDSPDELRNLILFITTQTAGEEEAGTVTKEAEAWTEERLGRDYAWPRNVRELEQWVRNVLVRKEYHPSQTRSKNAREELAEAICAGTLTADELLRRYCTLVYARSGSYQEAARRLNLDRRSVKSKIDLEFLEELKAAE